MTDLAELLERVKAATGPDRELDFLIQIHVAHPLTGNEHYTLQDVMDDFALLGPEGMTIDASYTASIDAALALTERVLPGEGPNMVYSFDLNWHASAHAEMAYAAELFVAEGDPPDMTSYQGQAHSLPLAILAATLSALIHQEGTTP